MTPLSHRGDDLDEVANLVRFVSDNRSADVVFDLDGTLVLLDMPWPEWTAAILDHLPESIREEVGRIMNTPGAAWGAALNAHLRDGTISHQAVVDVSRSFEEQHRGHIANIALLEVLPRLLEGGCQLHLWTSNVRDTAERVLTELGVRPHFTSIVARDDVVLGKPDLEGWVALDLDATAALIVGDSQNDELAAQAAGVPYYAIGYFHTPRKEGSRR